MKRMRMALAAVLVIALALGLNIEQASAGTWGPNPSYVNYDGGPGSNCTIGLQFANSGGPYSQALGQVVNLGFGTHACQASQLYACNQGGHRWQMTMQVIHWPTGNIYWVGTGMFSCFASAGTYLWGGSQTLPLLLCVTGYHNYGATYIDHACVQ